MVICDVLYLLGPRGRRAALVDAAVDQLPGDGVLLLKETAHRPVEGPLIAEVQERLATGVLRHHRRRGVDIAEPRAVRRAADRAGASTSPSSRIDRRLPPRPRPHHRRAGACTCPYRLTPGSRPTATTSAQGIGAQPDDAYFDVMAKVARDALVVPGPAGLARPGAAGGTCPPGRVVPRRRLRHRRDARHARRPRGRRPRPVGHRPVAAHAARLDRSGAYRQDPGSGCCGSLAEQLPFADGCAGTLVSMCVIEHLDDDLGALREYQPGAAPRRRRSSSRCPPTSGCGGAHDELAAHRPALLGPPARRDGARPPASRSTGRTYLFSFLVLPAHRHAPHARCAGCWPPPRTRCRCRAPARRRRLRRRWPGPSAPSAPAAGAMPFGLSILLVGPQNPPMTDTFRASTGSQGRSRPGDRLRRQARIWRPHRPATRWRWVAHAGAGPARRRRAPGRARRRAGPAHGHDVARELGDMKGAVMKLGPDGQLHRRGPAPRGPGGPGPAAAGRPPDGARAGRRRSSATSWAASPSALFLDWDPVPVAAASIGQVHRAVLHDGREWPSRCSTRASSRPSAATWPTPSCSTAWWRPPP